MKAIKYGLFLLLLVSFMGCAVFSPFSAEQQLYLDKALSQPLEFKILKSEVETAWERAQTFISQYSSMKILGVTDLGIETHNPPGTEIKFGYFVYKKPAGDNFNISVKCICGNSLMAKAVNRNAHILAYYIKTGELPNPELIKK